MLETLLLTFDDLLRASEILKKRTRKDKQSTLTRKVLSHIITLSFCIYKTLETEFLNA